MATKGELAKQLFESGYNCSQAVLLAFADDLGLERETAARLSSSFGGGMGRLREVCGAVSGAFMVLGLKYGYDDPKAREEKKEHYQRLQQLAAQFRQINGSIVCRELLGLAPDSSSPPSPEERTAQYYKKRPCSQLVQIAADLTESYIKEHSG